MNCFTHAMPFLDEPVFLVGCCVPDWLSAADRKCRVRESAAESFAAHDDEFLAEIARGIVQHHKDDHWFHQTQAFAELSLKLTAELRELTAGDPSFRPSLVGHVIIELLLDAYLSEQNPGKLDRYYESVASVDSAGLQQAVNQIAKKPTDRLIEYVDDYLDSRFLFDYVDDERLRKRLNNVLARVRLPELGAETTDWITSARKKVYDRAPDLLANYTVPL